MISAYSQKFLDSVGLEKKLGEWRSLSKKIVFTNGCFDILHPGHVDYLSKAAQLGDLLIIGLNSDESVTRLKGSGRPVNNEYSRIVMLAAFYFVSAVVVFEEDTPYELIKKIQPDILVKGGDYKPEEIVGYDIVRKKGGSIKTVDFLPGYSTTSLIMKIQKTYRD